MPRSALRSVAAPVLRAITGLCLSVALTWPAAAYDGSPPKPRPRADPIPVTRWDFRPEGEVWSRAALTALRAQGARLVDTVPDDITQWCPGYPGAPDRARRAFWVGFLSTLAKHESTWRPRAVGGGGQWYGLLQILPDTARRYGCHARSGADLKNGAGNLACALRIMAVTVPRDRVISRSEPRWSGVAADWGPMRDPAKRLDMANWLRGQPYCQMFRSPRPRSRPVPKGLVRGPYLPAIRPEPRPVALAGTYAASDLARLFPIVAGSH